MFLDRYRKKHPDADLLFLDARHLGTDRSFDCIYSNKVLHHLTRDELAVSFERQRAVLNDAGLVLRSFWYGTGEEVMHALRFTYYTEVTLQEVWGEGFEVLALERYQEIEERDSLYVLLRKRKG